ncbi:MAG: hypothetical protein JRK53_24470 [Deltaproteobacteria bacterium]|nr:hypothetical protein [Deltaproteobacteria bacterium]
MRNKYIRRSKLSEGKFRELLRCFCLDLDAVQIAALVRLNRNTVNRYLRLIRQRISDLCESSTPFGSRNAFEARLTGVRIPHASGIQELLNPAPPVFGVMEKDGHVFTEILPQPVQAVLKSLLSSGMRLRDTAHILRFRGYGALMYFRCAKPYSLTDNRRFSVFNQSDRAEPLWQYWLYTRKRLSKFQGIPKSTFGLHLKECDFRFNTRGKDINSMLLTEFRKRPIEQDDVGPGDDRKVVAFEVHERKVHEMTDDLSFQDFPEDALRNSLEA